MSVRERREPRFWGMIAALALVLLAIILIVVVSLSARMRQGESLQHAAPAEIASGSTSPAPPATIAGTAADRAGAAPARAGPRAQASSGAGHTSVRVVEKPVKVIEKQVKVIERQVRVIEKPVKVTGKPAASTPATSSFQDTGLPAQLAYQGKLWNAADRVRGLPADLLTADRQRVDGRTIYHDADAEAPYPHVYVRVSGQGDQYVRYVPTSS